MLVIRFFRVGKKNQPSFKMVVTDKKNPPRGGRFIEEVGFFNPLTKEKIIRKERINYWLSVGAQPSASVHNLLVNEKLLEGKKIKKDKKKKQEEGIKKTEETKKTEEAQKKEETPAKDKTES